jgi:TonB-linked SusC/RagA family outer membrane protein
MLTSGLAAQDRTISGTVQDSLNGDPIPGASVLLQGTQLSVGSRGNGAFVLAGIPAGPATLVVRAVGFRRRVVTVPAGQGTIDILLSRDVFNLEELVVTGQATGTLRRNLANAVSTVRTSDLGFAPAASVEQQVQGKVAGADIQANSGAPGGGLQVRLRGITSVNADAQPLYVVDGVIVSDAAIPNLQVAVTASSGGSNPDTTQDNQVNRIADLNPNDIETIEILKGASASAIYGGRASNGVVIITTKRGQPGETLVNVTQRFGFFDLSNKIGSRRFADAAEVDAVFGAGTAAANNFTAGTFFDHEEQLGGRSSLGSETALSLSGGDANTRFFASGLVKNDEGIVTNTGFQKQSVRLNLDQDFNPRLRVSLSTNILHTLAKRGLTNNDNTSTSYFMSLAFTPSFVDLSQNPDGTFPDNPFVSSNALQTAALVKNDEDVWRFIASSKVDWTAIATPRSSVRFVVNGGIDFFNQENDLFFPPELQFEDDDGQPGTSLLSDSDNTNLNLDGNIVHAFQGGEGKYSATTAVGVQFARRTLNTGRIISRNLIGGQSNIDAATNVQVVQFRTRINNLGIYAQEELLTLDERLLLTAGIRQEELLTLDERLLLTAGIRGDMSSLNADHDKLHFFPKLSGSYRFVQPNNWIDEFKVRAAYGESGNEPKFGQKFTSLTATQNVGGLPGIVVLGTVGADDLKPERQREVEVGFDASFFGARAGIEFSFFQKNISDLLVERRLAPSSGFSVEVFNGGKMRTRGVELAAGIVPVQSQDLYWLFRSTFSLNRSKITDLPVPAFIAGGFGTSIGAFRIEEGASATQIVGNDTLPDGSIVVRKIGDANPDFRMSFTNDITWRNWNLHFLLDWQQGSDILNLTKLLYDFGQVSEDYADPIPGESQTVGEKRLAGFAQTAANYIEDASFLKLREITLSYDLPTPFVQGLWRGARYARLSVSARNLFTSASYSGHDPEVSNFGNQPVARNIDVAPYPPSRSFWFSINLGF